MFSLHWILVLTLLHYLTAAPIEERTKELNSKHARMETFSKELQDRTCLIDNTKFYSDSSVQPECIATALECASKELKVVASECFLGEFNATVQCTTIERYIQELLKEQKKATDETTAKTCKACETYPQKSHKDFLSDVKTLVQKFNTHQKKTSA